MKIPKVGLLTLILMAFPGHAFACTCALSGSVQESLQEADAVFTGEVMKVRRGASSDAVRVILSVGRAWKGVDHGRVAVWTEGNSAACGFPFAPAETYLVYAVRDPGRKAPRSARGELWVSACSRTVTVGNAAEDIAQLGSGWRPSQPGEPQPDSSLLLWAGSALLLLAGFSAGLYFVRRERRRV